MDSGLGRRRRPDRGGSPAPQLPAPGSTVWPRPPSTLRPREPVCRKNRAAHVRALNPGAPGPWSSPVPAAWRRVTGRRGDAQGPSPCPCRHECALWIRVNTSPSEQISHGPLLSLEGDSRHRLHGEQRRGRTLRLAASESGCRVAYQRGRGWCRPQTRAPALSLPGSFPLDSALSSFPLLRAGKAPFLLRS